MPLIKKQAVIVLQEIPIKVSVEEILDDYARFIHSSPDQEVGKWHSCSCVGLD